MDTSESTKIVYSRIQKLEPELVSKIVGYLLLGDNGEQEMIRLAFSPDNVIQSITNKAKIELGFIPTNQFPQIAAPPTQDYYLQLHNQMQHLGLDEQVEIPRGIRYNPRFQVYGEVPSKICHYFTKGFCRHGSTCRYLHGIPNEGFAEDHLFSPRSVEKLRFELTELLRSRNGEPVSIALLPMLYYEMYSKTLQAEGYLTESQRHGKAGFSLTKLLARMRPQIHIIERAHGQHSVILAEDLPRYLEYTNEQPELGFVPIGARQIYLTFPSECVFTEQEVSNYFSGFGPVQDVRIPCQQRRMFGFVTFLYPETVRKILIHGNPHFICGSRVLVKPYREKSRLVERRNEARKHTGHFSLQFDDGDPTITINSAMRAFNGTRLARKPFMEEIQLGPKSLNGGHGNDYSTTGLHINGGYGEQTEFMSPERFSFLLDVLKDGSNNEERSRCTSSSYNDHESNQGIDLPESPFAHSVANSLSTVM